MQATFKTFEDLPLTLQAHDVSKALGISKAGAYNLINSKGFPTIKLGKRVVVPKGAFIQWLENSTEQKVEM